MNQRGKYIIIEGADGSGKSTVTALLKERLEAQGRKVQTANILKDDPVSAKIRTVLTDQNNTIHPDAEACLYAAAVTNVYRHKVLPLLEQGIDVICDRSFISTWAYQIAPQMNVGNERPRDIFDAAYDGIIPDALIMLYVTPRLGLGRCENRDGQLDRLELRGPGYQEQVQAGYRNYVSAYEGRVNLFQYQNDDGLDELTTFVDGVTAAI
ncbi:putative thymidylate kinase [Ralstonia phage RP31]|nr:putative thymidylate kinase [Ralstonia phage RP31]